MVVVWVHLTICPLFSTLPEPASSLWLERHLHRGLPTSAVRSKLLRCVHLPSPAGYDVPLTHKGCILVAQSNPKLLRMIQILPLRLPYLTSYLASSFV